MIHRSYVYKGTEGNPLYGRGDEKETNSGRVVLVGNNDAGSRKSEKKSSKKSCGEPS